MQAKALLEVKPQFDEAGVNLIAVSVGEPASTPAAAYRKVSIEVAGRLLNPCC